jgi:hypothetical protein
LVQETFDIPEIGVHSNVDDKEINVMKRGKDIDGCASVQKVQNHLVRNLAWVRADSFCGDTVIGREDVDPFIHRQGNGSLANGVDLCDKVFQTAQAAEGLREAIEVCTSFLPADLAGRFDRTREVA